MSDWIRVYPEWLVAFWSTGYLFRFFLLAFLPVLSIFLIAVLLKWRAITAIAVSALFFSYMQVQGTQFAVSNLSTNVYLPNSKYSQPSCAENGQATLKILNGNGDKVRTIYWLAVAIDFFEKDHTKVRETDLVIADKILENGETWIICRDVPASFSGVELQLESRFVAAVSIEDLW